MGALPPTQQSLFETFALISTTTVFGALYGIIFALYFLCVRLLYLQLQESEGKRRHARLILGFISFLLICSTASLALNARAIQLSYIEHADYPGGPVGYEASQDLTIKPFVTTISVLDLIVEVSTMGIQIWRLWIVWSGSRFATVVTILPLLLLLTYIALWIPIRMAADSGSVHQLGPSVQAITAMDVAGYAALSASTMLVTALIVARILLVQRRNAKLIGVPRNSGPYLGIVAMLIESYALESAWSIASAISSGLNSPSILLFEANDNIIKVIAYFLVVYRVATGRGWTKKTGSKLTTLQWNHDEQTTNEEVSGIRS